MLSLNSGDGVVVVVPLECGNARILDFIQVLNGLGLINEQVCTSRIRTETPNFSCISDIPTVFVSKNTSPSLGIISGTDLSGFNVGREFLTQGLCLHEDTVVLVGRFGEGNHT